MAETSDPFELMEPPAAEPLLPAFGLWVWFAIAAAVVVIGLVVFLLTRRKAVGNESESMREAAYREAKQALESIEKADVRQTAVRCSLVLRKYLVAAVSDPALFETQEEFIARHDALKDLPPEARESVKTCFGRLARAKYAPDEPDFPADEIVGESQNLLETLHRGWAS